MVDSADFVYATERVIAGKMCDFCLVWVILQEVGSATRVWYMLQLLDAPATVLVYVPVTFGSSGVERWQTGITF